MSSTLATTHPTFSSFLEDWNLMRDSYAGERQVKSKGQIYLPPTANHVKDGFYNLNRSDTPGHKAYAAYKLRARFPNFTREAIQMAIGMMHAQPAKFVMPDNMKNIRSSRGENLHQLLRRINTEQLLTGRVGLLADLPVNAPVGKDIPYIATYIPEKIINWDDGAIGELVPKQLNLVVLNETEFVRGTDFSWEEKTKYRVLSLGPLNTNEGETPGNVYKFCVYTEDNAFNEELLKPATYRGQTLDRIPFVFINTCDLVTDPDNPPLLDLANLCMTIYRGEADYRQNLFMQGQDTFVTIGGAFTDDEDVRTGAGTRVDMPMGGDAKYVGVSSNGLEAQRTALEDDRGRAGSMGAQTLDTVSRERESGASLNIRMAARTADLTQIALAGAQGLQDMLRTIADWIGEPSEKIVVTPNLEFGDTVLTGQTMVEQQTARNLGYPISAKSLHQVAFDKGLTKLTFEEEQAQAEEEKDTVFGKMEPIAPVDRNPNNDPQNNKNPKDNQKEQTGGKSK
jgi:hypothetical protein